MIDLIKEELDMFIQNCTDIEIVERFDIKTHQKDIAIRINEEEYSLLSFMMKIKVLLLEMKTREDTYCKNIDFLRDKILILEKSLKEQDHE